MKKLGLCLLALAMVLGFASCNKDAETGSGEKGWYEKTIYFHGDDFFLSEKDAKKAGYNPDSEDDYYCTAFVYNHPNFNEIEKYEYFDKDEDGQFKDAPDNPHTISTFAKTADDFIDSCCGIINDMAIICWDGFTLNPKGATRKLVITFDEGDPLVAYFAAPTDDEITWEMFIRWIAEDTPDGPNWGEPEDGDEPVAYWHVFQSEYSKATKVLTITSVDLDDSENNSTLIYSDETSNNDGKITKRDCNYFPNKEYDYTYDITDTYYEDIGNFRRFDFTDYHNTPNVSLTKTSDMNTKIIVHFDQGPDLIYYFKDNRS